MSAVNKKKKTVSRKTASKKTASKKAKAHAAAVDYVRALRALALGFPDAYEEFPWGHSVAKVRKKVFAFLDRDEVVEQEVRFSVKLPRSSEVALTLPFATPTGYGLGRAGWVSFAFTVAEAPPLAVAEQWLRESFVAVAPKKLGVRLAELPPSHT